MKTKQALVYDIFTVFFVLVLALSLTACASMSESMNYEKEAKEHEFEYYFPVINGEKTFAELDLAYAYVNEAIAKFNQTSGKSRAKGAVGILNGPTQNKQGVKIFYFMTAFGLDGENVLTDANAQQELKANIGASLNFLIFAGNNYGCISRYYLKEGFTFNNNLFPAEFYVKENEYAAYYTVWSYKRLFEYLRGESAGNANQANTKARYMLVNSDTLNVRSGPSADYGAVGHVTRGARVQVLESSGQWWKIRAGTVEGYVNSSYLREE